MPRTTKKRCILLGPKHDCEISIYRLPLAEFFNNDIKILVDL